jgi:hypothetical protein
MHSAAPPADNSVVLTGLWMCMGPACSHVCRLGANFQYCLKLVSTSESPYSFALVPQSFNINKLCQFHECDLERSYRTVSGLRIFHTHVLVILEILRIAPRACEQMLRECDKTVSRDASLVPGQVSRHY